MAGQIIKRGEKTWLVRIFMGRDGSGKRRYMNKTIRGIRKTRKHFSVKRRLRLAPAHLSSLRF